jgi:class 3 adenylate cyclase
VVVSGHAASTRARRIVIGAAVEEHSLPLSLSDLHELRQGAVLVVDDDADQQELLKLLLTTAGYDVSIAGNAEEALASIAASPPDVVILDVMMPGIDGFEACRRIRANTLTLDLPVVLVTALNSREERVTGIEAGADDFLSKPVSREELLARVHSLVRLNFARKALAQERLLAEKSKTDRMRATFERYVAPSLVEQILSSPGAGSALMEARRVDDAVAMFADLRGFTRMCAALKVEAAVDILNGFFTQVVDIAMLFEGTTLGMAGDSLLVGFNVPFTQADAAHRAILCSVEMLARVKPLRETWRKTHGVEVGVGVGISRGSAIFGNVGAPSHMAYTLIGDAVNVAARLTQQAGGGEILLSTEMASRAPDLLRELGVKEMPPISLKGKDERVPYFRLVEDALPSDVLSAWMLRMNLMNNRYRGERGSVSDQRDSEPAL